MKKYIALIQNFVVVFFGVLLFFNITSCKSNKELVSSSSLRNLSTKKIIRNHTRNSFKHKTVSAMMSANLHRANKALKANIKLRVKKDSIVWLSASKFGITFAKFIATRDSVKVYNKFDKTYFAGDFTIVQKILGAPVDFLQLQNILFGQALVSIDSEDYHSSVFKNSYKLEPKKEQELLSYFFLFDPSNFKIKQQTIQEIATKKTMNVAYDSYQKINNTFFPKKMEVTSNSKENSIAIDFKRVAFDQKLSFPFHIPSNYQKISIK